VRLAGCGERVVQETKRLHARAGCVGRSGVAEIARLPRGPVDGDEARVPVGELEVPRPVDRRPRLGPARVLEVVVADQADVRNRQPGDELEVVLVPIRPAGPGEVAEVRKENRGGAQRRCLTEQLDEDGVRGRVRPRTVSPITTNENG
jgi:hypothetical protein